VKREIPIEPAFIGALSLVRLRVGEWILPAVIAARVLGIKRVYLPYKVWSQGRLEKS